MEGLQRLLLILIATGIYQICEINPQKSTRSVDPSGYGFNEIYSRQFLNSFNRFDAEKDEAEKQLRKEEEELVSILSDSSEPIDFLRWDSVGDRVISHANVTEETKRVVRQIKKQRPGFFWTLFRVAFETVNETKSAVEQISNLLAQNIAPDTPTSRAQVLRTTKRPIDNGTSDANVTTTAAPFKLTQSALQSIIRKNVKGLVRLFNIEWKEAIDQSQRSVKDFKKDLSKSVAPFLADNPDIS